MSYYSDSELSSSNDASSNELDTSLDNVIKCNISKIDINKTYCTFYQDTSCYRILNNKIPLTGNQIVTYTDNTLYTGNFIDGYWHGDGTAIFRNKNKYIGSFENGRLNGSGTMYYRSGDTFTGTYMQGNKQGYGEYTTKNNITHSGEFRDNMLILGTAKKHSIII